MTGYYDTRSPAFVSRDRGSTYFAIALKATGDKELQEAGAEIADRLSAHPGVVVGGFAVAQEQVNKQVEEDLRMAEMLAFPLLFLLSLLFFRSLVASVLPLMIGGLAIVGTFLILRVASEFGSISIFALNLTTALGLGLAIDYSLFIVSRYREEIARSGPGLAAMRRVLATSGRTVFFSSLTVAAALASLLVFPQRFLYSMGLGGALVALFAALISLTVLPAVLTMLGTRVNAGAPKFLQRRAEADAAARRERLLVPALALRDAAAAAGRHAQRAAADRHGPALPRDQVQHRRPDRAAGVGQRPPGLRHGQHRVPALPRDADLDRRRRRRAEGGGRDRGAGASGSRASPKCCRRSRLRGGVTAIQAISANPFVSDASQDDREGDPGDPAAAGGDRRWSAAPAPTSSTSRAASARHLPIALAIVIVATLVILFLMTGSVILPIKSLIMNFLNLSAVFGLLVLIFQDGRLEGFLDYTSPGAIEQTMPILLFAVAFGLSTDYAVFLLSRIKEARDNGASDSECVAIGLERTGRIVTAAALLFAVAMGAFATSQIIFIKENGVGTALAVLIDASIVRALLVPSLMELLGKWNWWAPAPLRRLHERFGISEQVPAPSEPEPEGV